ncbi:sulfotransferase [Jannaschia seohaensis]|uniref:Sulfotransferase family protein n=1 Tax=Jannaschia seohaensis TaxID=475081 RepID=A0A2Y9B6Z9_9RHOB|nr:sulfotransferase [Jannaschia seohaensis]PWJ12949.1 sulfotransferase family protein [Jannaschia seohaensis]SSA50757.1 Sulfotransferase family protein [Jannaschia seohaensis]
MTKTHLIVSGVARSGTTALAELLNSHGQVVIGIERYKFRYLRENVYDPVFFERDRFFDFQEDDTNLRPEARPAWAPVYDRIAEKWDTARVVGDKVPDLTPVLEDFLDAQPATRCLYILRNLKDVGLSWQTRADKPRDKWPQGKHFGAACESWEEQMAGLQALFDTRPEIKERFLLIDYDQIYRPETPTEAAILNFLGLDPDPAFSATLEKHRAFAAGRPERKVPPEWAEAYKAVDQAAARGLRKEARLQTARWAAA